MAPLALHFVGLGIALGRAEIKRYLGARAAKADESGLALCRDGCIGVRLVWRIGYFIAQLIRLVSFSGCQLINAIWL
jgi:hypothetical protein